MMDNESLDGDPLATELQSLAPPVDVQAAAAQFARRRKKAAFRVAGLRLLVAVLAISSIAVALEVGRPGHPVTQVATPGGGKVRQMTPHLIPTVRSADHLEAVVRGEVVRFDRKAGGDDCAEVSVPKKLDVWIGVRGICSGEGGERGIGGAASSLRGGPTLVWGTAPVGTASVAVDSASRILSSALSGPIQGSPRRMFLLVLASDHGFGTIEAYNSEGDGIASAHFEGADLGLRSFSS